MSTQGTGQPPQARSRSGLRQRPGLKVYLFDDVGRQEEHRTARVLRRDGSDGQKDQRRRLEAFQEGGRKRQAAAGSKDPASGRRQLSGSGGSESVPPAIAGDSLDFAVFAGTRRQDYGRQAGRLTDRCRQWARRSIQEEG